MSKLQFPKIKINYGLLIKYGLLLFLIIAIVFGIKFLIQKKTENTNRHDTVRGNIENLYYYLKKEPENIELFAVLRAGDGVSVSVWENYVSTSEDKIKKFEKQIKSDLVIGKNYSEIVLYGPLGNALNQFRVIRDQNQERIEARKSFSKEKLIQNKKVLADMLAQISADSKKVGLDLR